MMKNKVIAMIVILIGLATVLAAERVTSRTLFKPHSCTEASERVKKDDLVSLRLTVSIAPGSRTGTPGKVLEKPGRDPVRIAVGYQEVVPGLEQGILGMCVHEQRRLTVPPALAYGSQGMGDIPADATIRFDVEVVKVERVPNVFAQIDANRDGALTLREVRDWFTAQGAPAREAGELAREVLRAEDLDRDGTVSWDEYSGPKGNKPPAGRAVRTMCAGAAATDDSEDDCGCEADSDDWEDDCGDLDLDGCDDGLEERRLDTCGPCSRDEEPRCSLPALARPEGSLFPGDGYLRGTLRPARGPLGGFCAAEEGRLPREPRVAEGPDGTLWLELLVPETEDGEGCSARDDEEEPEFNESVRPAIDTRHTGVLPGYAPLREGSVWARDRDAVARLHRDEL